MKLGSECFLENKSNHSKIQNKKLAYLGHSASVSANLQSTLSLIQSHSFFNVTCVFSPQHGWHGVEQANMIPSQDSFLNGIPMFSLYKDEERSILPHQLEYFDILIIDLQDVGCRIYTYLTTMLDVLNCCAKNNKSVIILDRPNPAGRIIEGSYLNSHFKSMVGAWFLPIRYGMTLGEVALAYSQLENLYLNLEVVKMENYQIENKNKSGWPSERSWLMPSPNMTDLECVRCYSGTVLLEGTNISEGRGTTSPLKVFGYPKMKADLILKKMMELKESWLKGCVIKTCFFKPTFDKYKNEICSGIRIYADDVHCQDSIFRPYRLVSLFLKSLHLIEPDWEWKLLPPYEYEYEKWPIDILSGDSFLREWIEDPQSKVSDLDEKLTKDEKDWKIQSAPFYLY